MAILVRLHFGQQIFVYEFLLAIWFLVKATNLCLRVLIGDLVLSQSLVKTSSGNFGQLPNLCLRVQQLEPTKAQSSAVRQILELCLRVQQLDKFWATAQSLSTSSAVRTD